MGPKPPAELRVVGYETRSILRLLVGAWFSVRVESPKCSHGLVQLLGMQSNDIDIALTDMMGLPFAEKFQEYCRSVKGIPIEKIAKVERNPDRSKHLETAKATVLDIELDFVNLRSEEYAEDSRIPTQVVCIDIHWFASPIIHRCRSLLVPLCKMLFEETLRSTRSFTTYIQGMSRTTLRRWVHARGNKCAF